MAWIVEKIREWLYPDLFSGRSSKWREFRNNHIKSKCEICGRKWSLEAHHKIPVNVDSSKELEVSNLVTLCRRDHFIFGHLGSWYSYNPSIDKDVKIWRDKIKQRP